MIATQKLSISLAHPLWNILQNFNNKSAVISEALELFFSKKEALKNAENIYWKNVEKSLQGENNSYSSLNPDNEEITEKLLEEKLWK